MKKLSFLLICALIFGAIVMPAVAQEETPLTDLLQIPWGFEVVVTIDGQPATVELLDELVSMGEVKFIYDANYELDRLVVTMTSSGERFPSCSEDEWTAQQDPENINDYNVITSFTYERYYGLVTGAGGGGGCALMTVQESVVRNLQRKIERRNEHVQARQYFCYYPLYEQREYEEALTYFAENSRLDFRQMHLTVYTEDDELGGICLTLETDVETSFSYYTVEDAYSRVFIEIPNAAEMSILELIDEIYRQSQEVNE